MSTRDDRTPGYDERTGWAPPAVSGRADARAVFARTMFLVAVMTAFFAAGAFLGRDLTPGWALGMWAVSLGLIFAVRPSSDGEEVSPLQMVLVFTISLLIGLAVGPTIAFFAETSGGAVIAQAAGLTGLFMALMGSFGYMTSRDLSTIGRVAFFALIALIVFGIVMIFVSIPAGMLIYCIGGLVIFAGLTAWDFQRLRHAGTDEAAILALAIFLDAVNVFLLILRLLGSRG